MIQRKYVSKPILGAFQGVLSIYVRFEQQLSITNALTWLQNHAMTIPLDSRICGCSFHRKGCAQWLSQPEHHGLKIYIWSAS